MFFNLVIKHIKMIVFFCITFNIILVSGSSLSDKVHQTPADMYKKPGEQAKIRCSHSIQDYNRILWYKQLEDRQLDFLGYMLGDSGTPEKESGVKITGNANKDQNCTLTVEGLKLNSSAVYFCAASYGSSEAYFGAGTKLTVLDPDKTQTPPKVKVLPPSKYECLNQKAKQQKNKTLVCVASGFYPDHVSVVWQIDGVNTISGVATDNAALKDKNNSSYSITSRLTVPPSTWFTRGKKFTCIVSFTNETKTSEHPATIRGVKDTRKLITRETYWKITQTLKLSYGVFIAKSCVYGAFVVFLVWKLQSSSGKHTT
ncbi:immunoglobulin lambda-1 light chain-like [Scomber japonicus]|uniref:immunoglobulin lambda-1 light chain-like n=1 Tax=Scomber japonicus TaxID=13676 RepID=UPI0023066786|nr:immunoglobulin lambda-1 light chain-like [Scomber japonicus]